MIRKAVITDIDSILSITKACTKTMIENDIFQWNAFYPSKSTFINDINRNELYTLEKENVIIGCIVISTLIDEEYKPVKWLTENGSHIYIHRLAIHPNFQKKGYAQQLMGFAESYAKDQHYTSIRLDTFSQNRGNQKFYEKRGYQKLECIHYLKQSMHPFYCYELIL